MNSEYRRMKALLEPMGISFEEGGISEAEIYAYAKGAEAVRKQLEAVAAACFPLPENGNAKPYADLLNIDISRHTEESLKAEILARMAHGFGDYGYYDAMEAFEKIGSGYFKQYPYTEGEPVMGDVVYTDLPELVKFIESFIFSGTHYTYEGSGMRYSEWDALDQTFNDYDTLNAPFDILDSIRS